MILAKFKQHDMVVLERSFRMHGRPINHHYLDVGKELY